jgi:signal peptidase I
MAAQPSKKPEANSSSEKPVKKFTDPILESRETIESFAVAIILALLFRAFIAEAFVIPTGSMAPTLMGRHVDTTCQECKYAYQASASCERDEIDAKTNLKVVDCRCPSCGFRQTLDTKPYFSNDHSFSGDRIIVSKFAYQFSEPKRWDVIVFKYPQGAHKNYIKRLVGLPNETVRIEGGNLYTKKEHETEFHIARKPNDKLLSMLQIVHDSRYVVPQLAECQWPARWQSVGEQHGWKIDDHGQTLELAKSQAEDWSRYHHVEPDDGAWAMIQQGDGKIARERLQNKGWAGQLISDFYAYNSARQIHTKEHDPKPFFGEESGGNSPAYGQHWVDDLAVECTAEVQSPDGSLLLDLVRGGTHSVCRIDVATGKATLSIRAADGAIQTFEDDKTTTAEAMVPIQGSGTYQLRFSNVDHELRLWVNEQPVTFSSTTGYRSPALAFPDLGDRVQGDLAPVGLGGQNVEVKYTNMRILRDKYYIAVKGQMYYEYRVDGYPYAHFSEIASMLMDPNNKEIVPLLKSRQAWETKLEKDCFLPLGDNSPASADARSWSNHYVGRHLLVGRAVCIYWPHSWWYPWGWPNYQRMKPIH